MSKSQVFPRVTAPMLMRCKAEGRKIVGLTAYDAVFAALEEEAGVDFLLVGDSAGNVVAGHSTTIPMTMDAMLFLTRCVSRGTTRVMVIADMPFGSFQVSTEETVRNAVRFLKEGGAQAVKMEGAGYLLPTIRKLVEVGIPVMGHLGLTPQKINVFGGYGLQAKTREEAETLLADAVGTRTSGMLRDCAGKDSRQPRQNGFGSAADSHHRHRFRAALRRADPRELRSARGVRQVQAEIRAALSWKARN